MAMIAFVETANTEAWRPWEAKPAVVLTMKGAPKLKDVAIYAQALLPRETLRIVGDSPAMQPTLERFCATHGLIITHTNEDRVLTIFGCYAHYYFDIQKAPMTHESV